MKLINATKLHNHTREVLIDVVYGGETLVIKYHNQYMIMRLANKDEMSEILNNPK